MSTQFDIQPVAPGRWRVLAPFRFREYRLLIAAVSLSIFAEGMWAVVIFVIVHIYTAVREDIMSRQSLISSMISGERVFRDSDD